MSMHIYIKVKSPMDMCAFDLSTNAWVHVNCQHYASTTTSMCACISALASTKVIIMCVHQQQPVCLSTFTTKYVSCVHVYMYALSFIAFDPCMCVHVNCQPNPFAVSTITSILAVTIHIACNGMLYMSASASTSFVYKFCLCTFTSKSNHLWTCVPSTFQLMHGYMSIINTMLVENNLNVCTRQHWLQRIIIMCVRRQQPVCLSTFTTVSCVHAYMYVHFFIAFDPCICVHVNRQPKPCAVSTIT